MEWGNIIYYNITQTHCIITNILTYEHQQIYNYIQLYYPWNDYHDINNPDVDGVSKCSISHYKSRGHADVMYMFRAF